VGTRYNGMSGLRNRHLVVWFKVTKRLECTSLIRNSNCMNLDEAMEDISTPSTPYLRYTALCGLNMV